MAGRTRNIQVIFRVDEQERGLIRQKMELMGVRNMQAYLRKMAIDGYAVKLDLPELRDAQRLYKRSPCARLEQFDNQQNFDPSGVFGTYGQFSFRKTILQG